MQEVLIDSTDGVMTITLNRVEKKNSFTQAMYAACADALEQARADAAVRVVVIQGHLTVFSAGNDIADFLNNPTPGLNGPVLRFIRELVTFPKPLIAALPALAPADGEEIGALLAAVRDHWSALRRTGIDGLRMSFLQRRGLLAHGDGVWRRRMQQESFDLLLGLLPWAIGQVRLPWMREPLLVEWPTP